MTRSYKDRDSDKQPALPAWQKKLNSLSRYSADEQFAVEPVKPEFGKRLVAFMIDVVAGYLIGLVFNMIPFVNMFVNAYITMILFLVIRDGLFQGRGVGKNLMGLQVVDIKTGEGVGLVQSARRNVVVFGPALLFFLITGILKIIPISVVNEVIMGAVNFVCGIYTLVVLPYEAFRTYSREDGLRWGDQFAGTAIVEGSMDFGKPL